MSIFRKVADYLRMHGRTQGRIYHSGRVCLIGGFAGVLGIHIDEYTATDYVVCKIDCHSDLEFLSKVIQADESAKKQAGGGTHSSSNWIVFFNDHEDTSTSDVLDLLEEADRQREILEPRDDAPVEKVPVQEAVSA